MASGIKVVATDPASCELEPPWIRLTCLVHPTDGFRSGEFGNLVKTSNFLLCSNLSHFRYVAECIILLYESHQGIPFPLRDVHGLQQCLFCRHTWMVGLKDLQTKVHPGARCSQISVIQFTCHSVMPDQCTLPYLVNFTIPSSTVFKMLITKQQLELSFCSLGPCMGFCGKLAVVFPTKRPYRAMKAIPCGHFKN